MGNPPGNPTDCRSGNGRFVRSPETVARDARACELRAENWPLQRIADELGISQAAVKDAIRRGMRDIIQGPAEKLLAIHMERLETLYEAAIGVLEADHVVVSHGKVITDEQGVPLRDSGPKLAAIREARASLESFRKLVGLDAEQKINVSGGVRYEVVGINPEDLT